MFSLMLAWTGLLYRVKEGKHVWIATIHFIAAAYSILTVWWLLRTPINTIQYFYRFL